MGARVAQGAKLDQGAPTKISQKFEGNCDLCGKFGHRKRDCWSGKGSGGGQNNKFKFKVSKCKPEEGWEVCRQMQSLRQAGTQEERLLGSEWKREKEVQKEPKLHPSRKRHLRWRAIQKPEPAFCKRTGTMLCRDGDNHSGRRG